jgi:hypothetical protein
MLSKLGYLVTVKQFFVFFLSMDRTAVGLMTENKLSMKYA